MGEFTFGYNTERNSNPATARQDALTRGLFLSGVDLANLAFTAKHGLKALSTGDTRDKLIAGITGGIVNPILAGYAVDNFQQYLDNKNTPVTLKGLLGDLLGGGGQ